MAALQANAALTQTTGAFSAVTSVDRSASFNSLVEGQDLSAYTEDLLSIATPHVAYFCAPYIFKYNNDGSSYYYPKDGNYDWVTIKTTDGRAMEGVEFLYANGWYNDAVTIDWRAYVGATLVSSGSTVQDRGTILGFSDPNGFEILKVRAVVHEGDTYQAIAIENLKVQVGDFIVPEPSTVLAGIGALGMLGVSAWKRWKQADRQ